ncbi:hypothetical protein Fmac_018468 [Flemingia macrophylla]|uniref:Uncharacterized protein n=1 Tax=Flemingia macrophylla TaxID=520843 RepID=A0ABD1M5G9_9FABA
MSEITQERKWCGIRCSNHIGPNSHKVHVLPSKKQTLIFYATYYTQNAKMTHIMYCNLSTNNDETTFTMHACRN